MRLTSPTMFLLVLMLSTPFLVGAGRGPIVDGGSNDFLFSSTSSALPSSRSVSLSNRTSCPEVERPPNRVNTTERVQGLISLLKMNMYAAYIIPMGDAHQSEYVDNADKRIQYISGFSGSAGTAVVLASGERALWTDGRYFNQAEQELDCDWILMKEEISGVPSVLEFLLENVARDSVVSGDATLLGYNSWLKLEAGLAESNITMASSNGNLVDVVWEDDQNNTRPEPSTGEVFIHEIKYAGQTVAEKLKAVRALMKDQGADAFFVTALDDVAWLYNIRGYDVPYNPVVKSYALVDADTAYLYVDLTKITADVMNHLNTSGVSVRSYEAGLSDLESLDMNSSIGKVLLPNSTYSDGCSFEVYNKVSESKRLMAVPPTLLLKARKNAVEIEEMKAAHVQDAVALCSFVAFLEREITAGNAWTELTAQQQSLTFRNKFDDFVMESFEPISGYGANGAVIHYAATPATDTPLGSDSLYLFDSGGQYHGATTDVTRTFHFGTPDDEMIEMYTRVLIGMIDYGNLKFPDGTTSARIEILARRSLYSVGLNYRHGTSHGIGMMLNVHEPKPSTYEVGHVMSDEPGFYIDGKWGIRIENQIYVKETDLEFDRPYYTFEHMTLVPFEPKLIDEGLLSNDHIDWLNSYYQTIRAKVGQMMLDRDLIDEHQWLLSKTEPIEKKFVCDGTMNLCPSLNVIIITIVASVFILRNL